MSDVHAMAGGFPGFGQDAPLDLGDLSLAAVAGITSRLGDRSVGAFSEAAARVGFCSHPIRLKGSSTTIDAATGEVLAKFSSSDAPLGVLYRACGNRRESVCPACSRVYARDTFEMIRAGLLGGKTVPAEVADNPLVFATLTAPSFGHVHGSRSRNGGAGRCRPHGRGTCPHGVPRSCTAQHSEHDPAVGGPLCDACYDWKSAVVWQWHAPELWRRFTIAMRRQVAEALGVRESALRDVASVQFAKVAEYQVRGLVHFHALIRLDGPDGPGSAAPLPGAVLGEAVREAARAVSVTAPPVDGADVPRVLRFGQQLDVRCVRSGVPENDEGSDDLRPEQVAGYLAKYSTKGTGTDPSAPRPHHRRLIRTCRWLAERARTACRGLAGPDADDDEGCVCGQCADSPYRLLAKWAHMLGFRGHFSSKSRRYSIPLGRLRRARMRFQRLKADADRDGTPMDTADLENRLLADEEETTLVVGSWTYQGTGWTNPGDKALADAAAARAREYAQWKAARRTRREVLAPEGRSHHTARSGG
ncbi:replication initiator [Isoptericola sp. b408]|uniref:replication initiator n=1 Tax=Isoptericola sp. b408 TaxID=3064653 RepID=UPI0027132850|nr:replication initiator [Isoptericola sp. b408]MDO8152109.1 hypothetical protein [Isoptericola sp. b408]